MSKFYFKKNKVNEDLGGYPNMTNPILGSGTGNTQVGQIVGFRYEILGMDHSMEQKINKEDLRMLLHPGNKVCGISIDDGTEHQGMIMQIHKDENSEIDYVVILDEKEHVAIKLAVDSIEYINYSKIDPNQMRRSNNMEFC